MSKSDSVQLLPNSVNKITQVSVIKMSVSSSVLKSRLKKPTLFKKGKYYTSIRNNRHPTQRTSIERRRRQEPILTNAHAH